MVKKEDLCKEDSYSFEMLRFINVSTPNEVKSYVDQFNSKDSTWIVSDLKSKLDIQSKCMAKDGFFLDDSILRISDFWRLWLRRLAPDLHVVSHDFIKVLVQNFMLTDQIKSLQGDLELELHQSSTVYKYLNELAPIVLSPQSDQIIQEWIKAKDKAWYKWYLIARLCMNYLIEEKKVIDSQWIPSLLQNLESRLIQWNKQIYLDLGSEMTSVEMGIFQELAKTIDVTIFVPNPVWKNKYKFLLNTYNTHQGFATTAISPATIPAVTGLKKYKRFSTEALEIKYIVSQMRLWIESGVEPKNIGLVSPRVEDYWPILKIHLDAEGIPYNKKSVTSLIGLGCFQTLLSKINSFSSGVTWESLEQSYYGQNDFNEADSLVEYEKFKAQFVELTEVEDLLRNEDIKKIFYNKINLKDKLSRLQFLALVFKIWSETIFDTNEADTKILSYLEMSFKDFLSSTTELDLTIENWMRVFSAVLSKKEITLQKANAQGIDIGSSQSNHLFNVQNMIWFGLDDSGFRKTSNTMIPLSDIEELKFNFDFPLSYPEESHTEFNIQWLSQYQFNEQIFTCSLFSSKAEPLNTSALILENNTKPDVDFDVHIEGTRIDVMQLQQAALDHDKLQPKIKDEIVDHAILVSAYKPTQLSMTDFTNYDHCGFKLLAAKGFKLKDYPVVSLDLDPRQRGSITHALFEYLVTDKKYQSYSPEQTEDFLEQKRIEYKLYIHLDDFWQAQKKKLLDTAQKFCDFESQRLGHSAVQHYIEAEFKLPLKHITINGRIDRMDAYQDHSTIIYDYKRSENDSTNYGVNWMDKKEFQMLFYILAIDYSFAEKLHLIDKGAYYFFYKNLSVYKGLITASTTQNAEIANSLKVTKTATIPDAEYDDLKLEFKKYINQVEEKIYAGVFSAVPYKTDICADCDWNTLCRAAHL